MVLFIALIFLIVIFILAYLIQYSMIDKYSIYFSTGPVKERVTILDKNLFFVTLGYLYKSPETITTLDFLLNYRRY
jgi:hypothetical protein